MHVNIFETKSDEELSVLYGQFLEAEKTSGFPDDNELGKIKKEYEKDFGANTVLMLQIELTHTIANRWFKNRTNSKPDMREKIKEYIDELNTEIKKCESELILLDSSYTQLEEPKNPQIGDIWISNSYNKYDLRSRIDTLTEVRNNLQVRLTEVV
nr:MAG TPA: kinase [Bacteriophage sp.]